MKKLFPFFLLLFQHVIKAQCGSGPLTVTGNSVINGSCKILGDLTILNGATLNVDLTSTAVDTFVVQGNILLQGNAVLWIHASPGATGEQFIVSNNFISQRTITTKDSSRIQLENIEFRTQEGDLTNASSIYMNYNAQDNSTLFVNKSWLDPQKAWILFNMSNKATLIGYEPQHLPTEIYMLDTARVILHGPNTDVGLWLNFQSITDTLNLPPDQTQPFTWKVGKGFGGLNTQWYLEIDTAKAGLGIQIFPSAKIIVNGSGLPATGELKVAMMFANGTDTVKNLNVGLQNTTLADGVNGSVTLHNVNLGPIAWQLYVLMNEHLFIKKSIINEIGIAGPSTAVVDSSLLQLAVLGAVGGVGCTMTVNNSEIWSQSINAANGGNMILNNCKVYGSAFSTTDAQSHITVNGGCFFSNPTGCMPATMINVTSGQPYCNPFIPAGLPQILTPATITLNGVNNNCTTGVEGLTDNSYITIYPNPFSNETVIKTDNSFKDATVTIYNTFGQVVKQIKNSSGQTIILSRNKLSNGVYFLRLEENNKVIATKRVVIID